MLTSLWGKLAQQNNMSRCHFVTTVAELIRIMTDTTVTVTDFSIVSDDAAYVHVKPRPGFESENINRNLYMAAFTTCWGRLRLLQVLQELDRRCCYHDTGNLPFLS